MEKVLVKIRSPFYGAGYPKCYGWVKDGFNHVGIGLDTNILGQHSHIDVEWKGVVRELDCEKAMQFAEKYDSFEIKGLTRLAVIAVDIFKIIKKDLLDKPPVFFGGEHSYSDYYNKDGSRKK